MAGAGLAACSPGKQAEGPTGPVELGAESEVAPGSSKLYRDQNVVVSRDAGGTLTAYSTICTHAGCAISKLDGTTLTCFCHGSEFDATNGKVLQAPASVPLKKLSVQVKNGRIVASPEA
ncbi:Rieske (2Fe-2S) protein [Streptomyces thermocoprophilus]